MKTKILLKNILLFIFLLSQILGNTRIVQDGIIDLTTINFNRGNTIRLNGDWHFYWNQFLTPDSFLTGKNHKYYNVKVPGNWNFLSKKIDEIKNTGYGTYHLQVKVKNGYYFLKIPPTHSAVKLWINGDQMMTSGTIAQSKTLEKPQIRDTILPIFVENNTIDIILNISNFHHNRGGLKGHLLLVSGKYFYKNTLTWFVFELFAIMLIFIVGLFHIIIYFFSNEEAKFYNLLFGFLSIVFSIRLLVISSSILFLIFPQINWHIKIRLEWILAITVIWLGLWYIISRYKQESISALNKIFLFIGIFISISYLIINTYTITQTLFILYIFGILVVIYSCYIAFLALKNKRQNSKIMIFGFFFLFVTLFIEVYYHYKVGVYINFITLGFLIIMIGHSLTLISRLHNTSKKVTDYKNHLEEMIHRRTKELEESKIQLEAKVHQVLLSQGKLQEINDQLMQQIKITKNAQEALTASEQKFRELSELLPEMVYETDYDLNFTYVNRKAVELFGYSVKEFYDNLNARELLSKKSLDTMISNTYHNADRKVTGFNDYEFVTKSGKKFLGWINGRGIEKNGKLIGFRGIVVDITKFRKNDIKIKKLQGFLFNIIDSMPSILIGINQKKEITLWNKSAGQNYQLGHKDVRKTPLYTICKNLEKYDKEITQSIKTGIVISKNIEHEEGINKKYENLTVYPLLQTNDGAVIRIDDITEKVKMEELLIQSEKMLSVGGLAAGMAHEINNPLAGMIQNSNVVVNRLSDKNIQRFVENELEVEIIKSFMESRNIKKLLDLIIASGHRAAQIVDNMLSFAKQGRQVKTDENINDLIDETLHLASNDYNLDEKFDFKKVIIQKELDENIPKIKCEKSKIQQVLFNLIKNSAEATHTKIKLTNFNPTIEIKTEKTDNNIRIEIKDNGAGISQKIKNRIFEPFFTTKPIASGTGLGLSVSYFIITKNHNGKMYAESVEGEGTTFILILPINGE